MKKLLVAIVAVVAVSFAACTGQTEPAVVDSLAVDTLAEEVVEDTTTLEEVVDTLVEEAVEEVHE